MASQQHGAPGAFVPDDDIDELFARANPNPDRVDCPSDEVLAALARRERAISDPSYEHLTKCSPCYRTFRILQQSAVPRRAVSSGWLQWVAVAAVLLLAAAAAWLLLSTRMTDRVSTQKDVQAKLDLRQYGDVRSDPDQPERQPLVLNPGRLDLTVLLPVGFEAGTYELQILDSELRSRASATGHAEIRDYVTTFRTAVDLSSLPAGTYRVAVRRTGETWRFFPAEIR